MSSCLLTNAPLFPKTTGAQKEPFLATHGTHGLAGPAWRRHGWGKGVRSVTLTFSGKPSLGWSHRPAWVLRRTDSTAAKMSNIKI